MRNYEQAYSRLQAFRYAAQVSKGNNVGQPTQEQIIDAICDIAEVLDAHLTYSQLTRTPNG